MRTSAVKRTMPNAISVEVSGKTLSVRLSDGRTVSVPVDRYPRFAYATTREWANWRIIGRGDGIHWEDIDEDISVEGLLAGNRSGESKTSLMRWLKTRPRPKVPPLKGKDYGKANDVGVPPNLLILGESQYGQLNGHDNPTEDVVHDHFERAGDSFFTKIMHTVLGPDTCEEEARFRGSIAFYSYVQRSDVERSAEIHFSVELGRSPDIGRSVGDRHEELPTEEVWDEAAVPFLTSLEWLHPTHILACGMRLWNHMPEPEGIWAQPSEAQIRWFDSVEFPPPDSRRVFCCITIRKGRVLFWRSIILRGRDINPTRGIRW